MCLLRDLQMAENFHLIEALFAIARFVSQLYIGD